MIEMTMMVMMLGVGRDKMGMRSRRSAVAWEDVRCRKCGPRTVQSAGLIEVPSQGRARKVKTENSWDRKILDLSSSTKNDILHWHIVLDSHQLSVLLHFQQSLGYSSFGNQKSEVSICPQGLPLSTTVVFRRERY